MTFPGWVEQQVRQAEAAGAFEGLPGQGKPIPDLDRVHDDMAWIANYLRRENVDVADVLPPSLRLAKEVETLDERLRELRSETRVRHVIEDLNQRIDEAYARPQLSGPPLRVKKVRVDAAIERWRAARPPATPPAPAPPAPPPPRRRWRIGPRRATSPPPG
jgi:DnaJ-like protein